MHTVAVVAVDQVAPFELAVPCEVFGIDRPELGVPWYNFFVCAAEEPPLRTSAGFTIDTPYRLPDLERADTIILPAWRDANEHTPEALLDALRAAHRRGARLVSICSGAFVLARTGLLDGLPATTHWMYAERFAAEFPRVRVDPHVLYVDAGQILTSAGTAAGIDLCLHIVRSDYGAEVANAVARRMVVPPHRDGGQAQYVDHPLPVSSSGDGLANTLTWALDRLHEPLSVGQLARHAAMSPRTFARQFRATTGTTPHQWLMRQRLLLAQRLLETTDHSVERIAARCGFGSAAAMRIHFRRHLATSPQAYRRHFQTLRAA